MKNANSSTQIADLNIRSPDFHQQWEAAMARLRCELDRTVALTAETIVESRSLIAAVDQLLARR